MLNRGIKILYITNARIPTEKAHGFQIVKMCEEFSRQGAILELILPYRKNNIKKDIFNFYNVQNNFRVKYYKGIDFIALEKFFFNKGYYLQSLSFFFRNLFIGPSKETIIYTRSLEIAWLFSTRGYDTFFEAHYWPSSNSVLYKFFLKKISGIVCNSQGTLNKHKENGFKNLLVAPNGVDIKEFDDIIDDKKILREKLLLPLDKKILMYVGHLYKWKGIDLLIKLAELLKNRQDVIFYILGGTDKDIKKYKEFCKDNSILNVVFLGMIDKKIVPHYLKSADLLFLPNISSSEESIKYTSPIKMFEYMASKVPIVASDLPSIREILNNNNAFLFKADDAVDFKEKTLLALGELDLAKQKLMQAYKDVSNFTWINRAKNIFKFIKK